MVETRNRSQIHSRIAPPPPNEFESIIPYVTTQYNIPSSERVKPYRQYMPESGSCRWAARAHKRPHFLHHL